jgi:hypothetical protein
MADWHAALERSITEGPRLFAEGVLGEKLAPWQAQAYDDMVTFNRHAWRSGHGVGKTHALAIVGAWFMTTRCNYKVPVTANSQDQLRDVTWPELQSVFRALPEQLRSQYDVGQERITLRADPENNFAVPRTASRDKPEALQGFHAQNLLFLVEEASGIEDVVFQVAAGALTSPGSMAVLAGNPTRSSGYFYNAFHRNRMQWHCRHIPFQAVIGQPWADPGYPASVAAEYGEHSNVYRVRVLGEFPIADDNAVIPLSLIEAAVDRDIELPPRAMVWGVDVARFGDDRSALVKRQGVVMTEKAKVWRNRDTMQTAGIVAKEYFETPEGKRPLTINIDVIGIGAGVVDRLREIGLPAFGVNVGETPEDGTRFMRRRDELWWKVRDWFNSRAVRIPQDDLLMSDLVGPTYKVASTGKIQIESKDDMKKRGVNSPDVADALCLTFAGGEHAHMSMRQSFGIDNYNAMDDDWQSRERRGTMQTTADDRHDF